MTTARSIIKSALLKISAIGQGENPTAAEAQDALSALNAMIGSWSVDQTLVFNEVRESFPLTIGQGSYTIGTGGDFNTSKPIDIIAAFVRINNYDYDLTKVDGNVFAEQYNKTQQGAYPNIYNYLPNVALGKLEVLDVPSSAMDIHIYSSKQLTAFPDLDTDITLGIGYDRAIIYQLAIELAPEYQVEPSNAVARVAIEALNSIKKYNSKRNSLVASIEGVPQMQQHSGNIYVGWNQ